MLYKNTYPKMAKYKIAFFDLDGTLIDEGKTNIWEKIQSSFDIQVPPKVANYEDLFCYEMRQLKKKGVTKNQILHALRGIKMIPGAEETLKILKENGLKLTLVSGGLNIIAEKFFPSNPFDYTYINKIYFNKQGHIISYEPNRFNLEKKVEALKEVIRLENATLNETVFIGDGFYDRFIAKNAGFSIAFNTDSKILVKASKSHIKGKDLTRILELIVKDEERPCKKYS